MKTAVDGLFNTEIFPLADIGAPGKNVEDSLARSLGMLNRAVQSGKRKWIITYSGGKDSTLLAIIACEIFRRRLRWMPDSIDIVYCDTLEEIPPMHQGALEFLSHIDKLAETNALPLKTHITKPATNESYWFLMLGKGYPPPHRQFWWCTERLKIDPVKRKLEELNHQGDSAVLTGVRFGESDRRDGKMRKASQCMGEGECGQILEYHGALAPIAHWKTCQVWDFLAVYVPEWEWPTQTLITLYGDAPVRFGCWTCTLVEKDQALNAITQHSEWEYLSELSEFRQKILASAASANKRVLRPNKVPGKFKMATRRELLEELKALASRLGLELIEPAEEQRIREYWQNDKKGDSY